MDQISQEWNAERKDILFVIQTESLICWVGLKIKIIEIKLERSC